MQEGRVRIGRGSSSRATTNAASERQRRREWQSAGEMAGNRQGDRDLKKTVLIAWMVVALVVTLPASASDTRFGAHVSVWDSSVPTDPLNGIFPIGGSGQVNGDFVVTSVNGVEIGLRAERRFTQHIDPLPNVKQGHKGIYIADAGTSDALGRATWNFDLHLDLGQAHGQAAGTALADYEFELRTNVSGRMRTIDLSDLFLLPGNTTLFQTAQNPVFAGPSFDPEQLKTYKFELRLNPRSFSGPVIKTRMEVRVVRN